MNIHEALKNKDITYIRQPHWNPTACLELPMWNNNTNSRGLWMYLIDLGNRIPMLSIEFKDDTYDKYEICEAKPFDKNINREYLFEDIIK